MYIYHFWALLRALQKDDYDSMLFGATYDLLVVLRKPWICTSVLMHFLANFCDFDDFGPFLIEKMTFWTPLRTSNSLLSKSHDISAFNPRTLFRTCSKPCYFDLIFHHFGTPLRVLGGGCGWTRTSCLWAGGPVWTFQNPCLDPQILVILTTFPIEKSQFCHFAYQGQWKCHFDPILTSFWALLSPNLWLLAKMCLFVPFVRRDLEGPSGTLIWP